MCNLEAQEQQPGERTSGWDGLGIQSPEAAARSWMGRAELWAEDEPTWSERQIQAQLRRHPWQARVRHGWAWGWGKSCQGPSASGLRARHVVAPIRNSGSEEKVEFARGGSLFVLPVLSVGVYSSFRQEEGVDSVSDVLSLPWNDQMAMSQHGAG